MIEIIESVRLVCRDKGTKGPWYPMSIPVSSLEDAKQKMAKKSKTIANALDLACRITTLYVDDE